MLIRQAQSGRVFVGRLTKEGDLLTLLTEICRREKVDHGELRAIGALVRARLAYYDQIRRQYRTVAVDTPCEIVSLVGNVSLKDGEPFVHAHLAVADADGHTRGGHLVEGCVVFAGEYVIQELKVSDPLERTHDEPTGLALWR